MTNLMTDENPKIIGFVFPFRYNFFKGCPKAKTCTIILRGGAEQFTEETERSLHDAIMIVRRAIKVGLTCGAAYYRGFLSNSIIRQLMFFNSIVLFYSNRISVVESGACFLQVNLR